MELHERLHARVSEGSPLTFAVQHAGQETYPGDATCSALRCSMKCSDTKAEWSDMKTAVWHAGLVTYLGGDKPGCCIWCTAAYCAAA